MNNWNLPCSSQENKRRTKYISKNLNPVWDHTVIYGNMHREELQYKMLEFTVWDYDRFKANDFLGQMTINLKGQSMQRTAVSHCINFLSSLDANVIDDKPHWYRLQALRSREEVSNRGSSPGLYKMTSVDSTASSTLTLNRNTINMQSRVNQRPWLNGSDFVGFLRFCALLSPSLHLSLFAIFLSLPSLLFIVYLLDSDIMNSQWHLWLCARNKTRKTSLVCAALALVLLLRNSMLI